MKVRRYVADTDYPIIASWWQRRAKIEPPAVILPQVGVVAFRDEDEVVRAGHGPVACAFLYQDVGGAVAMIEWECTNPDCSAMTTLRALNMIFDFFERFSTEQGYRYLLTWVAQERGDGRLLKSRRWVTWPGPRHELMCYEPARPREAVTV